MATSLIGSRGPTPSVSRVHGTGYRQVSTPTLSPEQMQLFSQIFSGASPGIGGGLDFLSQLASGDQGMFQQLEAPALRQFGQLQGNIANRFSQMGSGARHSSGFQNVLSSAAGDLSENLQSNRLGLQNQAIRDLLGMGQTLLSTPLSEEQFIPKKKPFWQELLLGAAPGIGESAGGPGIGLIGKLLKLIPGLGALLG